MLLSVDHHCTACAKTGCGRALVLCVGLTCHIFTCTASCIMHKRSPPHKICIISQEQGGICIIMSSKRTLRHFVVMKKKFCPRVLVCMPASFSNGWRSWSWQQPMAETKQNSRIAWWHTQKMLNITTLPGWLHDWCIDESFVKMQCTPMGFEVSNKLLNLHWCYMVSFICSCADWHILMFCMQGMIVRTDWQKWYDQHATRARGHTTCRKIVRDAHAQSPVGILDKNYDGNLKYQIY